MREAGPLLFALDLLPPVRENVVERPPPGMARGIFVVSPLVVTLVAGALLFLALGYYVLRLRKARRR